MDAFFNLLLGDDRQFEQLVRLVEGELAGDGNIADRMASSYPGAIGMPEGLRKAIDALKKQGLKPEGVRSRLSEMKQKIETLDFEFDEP